MITSMIGFFNTYGVPVNFIAHLLIFIGTLYVAVHNRKLPQWHVAPLWYVGLASLLVCITILIQWSIGAEHELSYWNFGQYAELLVDIALAGVATIMLFVTVKRDLEGAKKT